MTSASPGHGPINRVKMTLVFALFWALVPLSQPVLAQQANSGQFAQPFASNSIWNRPIPINAVYFDVGDAIWGNSRLAPNRVSIEQITIIYTDKTQPEVSIVKSRGWYVPGRAQTDGQVFYTRRFAPDAGIDARYPRSGNASFVIIDPETGIATEGSAGWREPGGDLITYYDEPRIHKRRIHIHPLF